MSAPNAYLIEIAKLREENELLRAENANLKDAAGGISITDHRIFLLSQKLKIRRAAARMLIAIVEWRSELIKRDRLWVAAFDDADTDPKVMDIYLAFIRKAITPHGATIQTVWGQGFAMSKESREIIKRLYSEAA